MESEHASAISVVSDDDDSVVYEPALDRSERISENERQSSSSLHVHHRAHEILINLFQRSHSEPTTNSSSLECSTSRRYCGMVILVPRYMHQSTFEIFCVDIVSYASFSVTETLFDALAEILWIVLLCALDRVPDVLIVVVVHSKTP
jgi:hypothetical protein